MDRPQTGRFADIIEAVKALPKDSQDLLVHELEDRLTELSTPQMTAAQRDEVKKRLVMPRQHVADGEVRDILRRYNPAL